MRQDGRLIGGSRGAKIETASCENAFLIIQSYRPNLCFFKSINVYENNYIRKSGDDLGIDIADADGDGEAGDPGTVNADGAKNSSLSIADKDRDKKANNPDILDPGTSIGVANGDR